MDFFFKQITPKKSKIFLYFSSKTHLQAVIYWKLEERTLHYSTNRQYFQIKPYPKSHQKMLIIPQALDLVK